MFRPFPGDFQLLLLSNSHLHSDRPSARHPNCYLLFISSLRFIMESYLSLLFKIWDELLKHCVFFLKI